MTSRIRLLLLSSNADPTDGWGNFTHELCERFDARQDVAFDLVLPNEASVARKASYGAYIHKSLPRWRPSLGRHPMSLYEMLRYRSTGSYDLIHCLVEFPYAILARRLANRLLVPYGVTTQGTYAVRPFLHLADRLLYKPAIAGSSFITAPSVFTAKRMREVSNLHNPISILHNPVNFDRFQRQVDTNEMRKQYKLPEEARVVLGVGGLKVRKGFDTLVQAIGLVIAEIPNVHLIVAGEGELRPKLEELSTQLSIAANVHFVGTAVGNDLVGLYHLCEVYAHLPINVDGATFEGFGIVYMEASSCGKPVVATRSGGVPDAVLDGKTGLLVDEGSAEQAACALLTLLRDDDLAYRLGKNGKEYARQHTWEWYVDEIMMLYIRALAKNGTDR